MTKDPIVVMKFDGSVLKDVEGFKRAADIIKAEKRKKIVAVSAMSGVTDKLYKLAELAATGNQHEYKKRFREIFSKYLKVLRELDVGYRPDRMNDVAIDMEKVLNMISYIGQTMPMLTAAIVSEGETLSAIVLNAYLNKDSFLTYLPAKEFFITDNNFLKAKIDMNATKSATRNIPSYLDRNDGKTLITEISVGATHDKRVTLFDQNQPDIAAILDFLINDKR